MLQDVYKRQAMTLVISQRIFVDELPTDKKDQLKKLTYKQLNDFLKLFSKKDEALMFGEFVTDPLPVQAVQCFLSVH